MLHGIHSQTFENIPRQLGSLVLWLNSSFITGLNNGDSVSQWNDHSGNGRHATPVSTSKPVYQTNVINGRPALYWSTSGSGGLYGSLPTLSQPFTLFAVIPTINNQVTLGRIFDSRWDSGTINGILFYYYDSTMPSKGISIYAGNEHIASNDRSYPITNKYYVAIYNGSSSSVRENGTAVLSSVNVGSHNLKTYYAISGGSNLTNGNTFLGKIAEIGLYNEAFSSAKIAVLEGYIKKKYGL